MMVTSCKGSQACAATLWAPNPAAGHHRPTPPLETPGHPQASLDSLLWGHCSFLLVLVHKGLLCPPRVYFLDLCKLWQLYGGLMVTSSKRAYVIPRSAAPRAYMLVADHCLPARPQETLRHSSVSVSVASLGPGAHEA